MRIMTTAVGNPNTGVWGVGEPLFQNTINIATDENGNFMGVHQIEYSNNWKDKNETVISPDAWNQQFINQPVWDGLDDKK